MGDLVVHDNNNVNDNNVHDNEGNSAKYLDTFNNFIKQLKVIFPNNSETFSRLEEECDTVKLDRGYKFVNSFDDENFNLFVKSKIKVFSHKNPVTLQISSSLFYNPEGDCLFYLKELLNNQPDQVKQIIWENLHSLYYLVELSKSDKNEKRLNMLSELLVEKPVVDNDTLKLMNDKINELMGDDVNETTREMITDMIQIFHSSLNKNNQNPLGNIMEMTKVISSKYGEKISNGEIQVDGLLKGMLSKIPGFNPALMDQFMGMMNNKSKSKEKVIIDENFSTANVDVGKQEEENNMNIRNMLKVVNMFSNKEGGMPNLSDLKDMFKGFQDDGSMPDFDKMTDMFKQMQESGHIPSTEKMKEFAMQFQENGTVPNMDSIINMVTQLQENPSMDNMFEMIEKMQSENMLPDMNTVLTQLKENPDIPDMEELLKLTEK